MSDLPPLPSSMQQASLVVAGSQNADAAKALTTPVQLNLTLDQGFQARDHLTAKKNQELQDYAPKLVRDSGFDAAWLAKQALKIPLDTSLLQQITGNTRNLDAGEVGKDTIAATHFMDRVNQHLPGRPNPRFMEAYQKGSAGLDEILKTAKWLAGRIKDALREFDSVEGPLTEVQMKLQQKFDLMFEAIVLNGQLAENEDDRTRELLEQTALFEYVMIELPKYVAELQPKAKADAALAKRVTQLNSLAPLVTKLLTTLKPLIFAGNAAVDRYLNLSSMAGGRALVLGLFLSAGMARWRSDIVTQLQEMDQLAVGLAEANIEQFMNQQAQKASGMFVQTATDYVALMNRWMTTADTMAQVADDINKAKDILIKGFAELVDEHKKVSSAVQDATRRIDEGKARYDSEMQRIAASA
jgi:hypothetical protein